MLSFRLSIAGLGIGLLGAIMVTLADTWLSRLLLTYFDAVETNLSKVVDALRNGNTHFDLTPLDPRRDKRLDQARSLKTLGWLAIVLGFGIELAVALMVKPAG